MKVLYLFSFLFFGILLNGQNRYDVASASEFSSAQQLATAGDSIVWKSGTYTNTRMDINQDGLIVTAEPYGTVLFTGVSRAVIDADNITFSGFQYIGGFIGNLHVIRVFGSNVLITHVNIKDYTSHKYLIVDKASRKNTISYCNFENRINKVDQNILSILVDEEPGYHKIQYCSFKNFAGLGLDEGVEPIRIGVSTQGHLDSRTLVEYCYFTKCNGDGEIISHKARQNVYRYNTFENNPVAQLVLRHGDEGIIYGNFFLNNFGGIRIREGSDHFIYNNYFEGLSKTSIWLMNDPVDPLSNVHIYHNTFVNSEDLRLGGIGNSPPSNVIIANNVFSTPLDRLFTEDTENETWINNLSFGNLGIDVPSTGLVETDPELYQNSEGFYQPTSTSPVIAAAVDGYPAVPLYEGMDYDNNIESDLMKVSRPLTIGERAIGASEFSASVNVQPHVTEMNTGPSYLFDNLVDYVAANASQLYVVKEGEARTVNISSNIDWSVESNADWISTDLSSGSGDTKLVITIDENEVNINRSGTITISGGSELVTIIVYQDAGDLVSTLDVNQSDVRLFPNPTNGKVQISNLPSGIYSSHIELLDLNGRSVFTKEYIIDHNEMMIYLDNLTPGTFLLNIKFMNQSGSTHSEETRKLVRK